MVEINGRKIGTGEPCFIVAEISCSHAGSYRKAKLLVRAAAMAGADAVKFQVFRPQELTCKSEHPAYVLKNTAWKGRTLFDLYRKAETPREWIGALFDLAESYGIVPFASVFGYDSLDLLERLGCEAYKIASAEVSDLEFVKAVQRTGKPVFLSDGMATPMQLALALDELQEQAVLLKCVSEYPARASDYRLRAIQQMSKTILPIGLSDHTKGSHLAVAAVALGACAVEKHLMLQPEDYWWWNRPLDKGHSVTPAGFSSMVRQIREVEMALALPSIIGATTEAGASFRQRLVFREDLGAGTEIDTTHLRTARCSEGMEPDRWEEVYGRTTNRAVRMGDPVTEECLR